MLRTTPAVFAVEDSYQIMVPVTAPSLFWVEVEGQTYYDESNGILRSLSDLHRVSVPAAALDRAGCYTVFERPIVERKPYFTETAPVERREFSFTPVPSGPVRAYHISDAHGDVDGPIRAAKAFGRFDFLILNGDILNHSGNPEEFYHIYAICEALTGGRLPVVFSRGNHDLRGNFAEQFAAYTPNSGGNTYYSFRLGDIWGVVLDCGEDKTDDHAEYGHTVCCHAFRQRQTAFLRELIHRRDYADRRISCRVAVSHVPFPCKREAPFDIEQDTYREWGRLLRDSIRPDVMLCGHTHELAVRPVGGPEDAYGQPCTVVEGGCPTDGGPEGRYTGCGYTFGEETVTVQFTDSRGGVSPAYTIEKNRR